MENENLNAKTKQIIYSLGKEKYSFKYKQGQEDGLLNILIDFAKNPELSFDWYDSAVISFKLIQNQVGLSQI